MDIDDQRASLCAAAHQLAAAGLATGTSGNLSVRVGDQVLITPSDSRLKSLDPEQLVVVDLDGTVAVPTPYRPTSELHIHLGIYRSSSVAAVAHAHPASSVAVANIVDELPPIHYAAATIGGSVRVAPYAVFGSVELSEVVKVALYERSAALMRNHGSVAVGGTIETACDNLELVEWLSDVYLRSVGGGTPAVLDGTALTEVVAAGARRHYTPFPGRNR
ncbi:class II aldolase/adducin family protein [Gordonia sp. NPDC003376]